MNARKLSLSVISAAALVMMSAAADARLYDIDFYTISGPDYTVKGQVTTSATANTLSGYDITGIRGYLQGKGGGVITGLESNPNPPNQATTVNGLWYFDNVVYTSPLYVDNAGIAFFANGQEYNLYSVAPNWYYLSTNNPAGSYNAGSLGVMTVAVPEASTWVMMLLGFVSIGLAGYHKEMKNSPSSGT